MAASLIHQYCLIVVFQYTHTPETPTGKTERSVSQEVSRMNKGRRDDEYYLLGCDAVCFDMKRQGRELVLRIYDPPTYVCVTCVSFSSLQLIWERNARH
jgi:hypothetical protein